MKMRPPATPLINVDPYFSVWCESDHVHSNTVHWTGKSNSMAIRLFVDGEEFHLLGLNEKDPDTKKRVNTLKLGSMDVDCYSTELTYENERVRVKLKFTSPVMVDDLYYASRPVSYLKASCERLDGSVKSVRLKVVAGEELVLNRAGEGRALSKTADIEGITAISMGRGRQRVLWRSDDDVRIDWGYFYLGVKGEAEVGNTVIYERHLGEMYAVYALCELDDEALILFAYDDIESIQYFGDNLKAYWKKDGKTIEEAIAEAAEDYEAVLSRCDGFSKRLWEDAVAKGGEKYAELLQLATRQVMNAHKLVVDKEGNNLFISKECHSNGCAATVDVTYPSAPMFLIYNPELLKGMLRPVMRYAASEEWIYDFAPHDVGQYPLVNGQVYGVKRNPDKSVEISYETQMPVEECGNMLILFAAICEADNAASFVKPYIETVDAWSKYLIKYGLDPENQLCTDDFAGHLAHNVNLAIKAIMGIEAYSMILERLGDLERAKELDKVAREYAASLEERAKNSDGSLRLAYDKPESFSLKYNSVWDKIWRKGIFTESFYKNEIARYKKEMLPYGVPLDSRRPYTKSDWLIWVASLADSKEDFNFFADSLWAAYNTMRSYAPMTDWYYCDTSHMAGFRNRTVQGGLFIRLMLD